MSDSPAPRKTVLAPCMGVGKIVANVTRRAAYMLHDQCPDQTELLSIPALLAGDPHERELIEKNPTIVIDGCALRCAAHIFRHYGVEPVAKIEVNQVMKEKRIGPGKTRKDLEESGRKLSDFTAERVLNALNDEGLLASFVENDDEPGADLQSCSSSEILPCSHAISTPAATPVRPADPSAPITAVSIMPCQGIKRTGGRITQRAAYIVAEDRFLGRSQVVCISALAAGVDEDIQMVEKFPTVALNGCGMRCASKAAEHFNVPAVAHVDLQNVDPAYDGAAYCLEPDLTDAEKREADTLADALSAEVKRVLSTPTGWAKKTVDLHGLIVEPAQINAKTGYRDNGQGILVRLAQAQLNPSAPLATPSTPHPAPRAPSPSVAEAEVAAAKAACENPYPGLRAVTRGLFAPKPGAPAQKDA